LYKIHEKHPTALENQPKLIDPAKLTGFRFNASNTSKTILGFNRILWDKTGGFPKSGEEITDLGLDDNGSEVTSVEHCMFSRVNTIDFSYADESPFLASGIQLQYDNQQQQQQQQQQSAIGEFDSFDGVNTSSWKHVQPERDIVPIDQPVFDLFRPFNPVMRDLDGDMLDLSGLNTDSLCLDFFGGDWEMSTI
jgi:hypothetical protein